jgi:hypothetical protein
MKECSLMEIPRCLVREIVEPLGTDETYVTPQDQQEALANHGAVQRAIRWAEDYDVDLPPGFGFRPPSVSVSVTARGNLVTVRWFATGEADEAKAAMLAILAGQYEGYARDEEGGVA